jgi:hypothetical protein
VGEPALKGRLNQEDRGRAGLGVPNVEGALYTTQGDDVEVSGKSQLAQPSPFDRQPTMDHSKVTAANQGLIHDNRDNSGIKSFLCLNISDSRETIGIQICTHASRS